MRRPSRLLSFILAVTMAYSFTLPPQGWALVIPNEKVNTTLAVDRNADMQLVQKALESKVLRERLREHGLTDKEIDQKIAQLSDAQLHQLAKNIEAMTPAGDSTGIVVTLLVIAILVLLFVYLLKRV